MRKAELCGECSRGSLSSGIRGARTAAIGLTLTVGTTGAAWANCTTTGNVIVCTPNPPNPSTSRIGNGPSTPSGTTVTVQSGAQVSVTNSNAISLGDNATITLQDNSSVVNNATSGNGQWNAGNNTIEFGSNGRLTVGVGATVTANGTQNNGEPVNVMGTGNVITNYGTIASRSGAAIWFEDRTIGSGNTIDNYGVIRTQLGANSNVIGNQGNSNVTFINRSGARVEGSLSFAGGNDALTLETGSVITGSFNGGGGTNTLSLSGAGSDSLAGDIRNFQTLTKDGIGTWTLTGAVGANGGNAPLQVLVNQGTLSLTGNNANFSGSVTVNAAGTLEARAQSLPPTVTDNGLVRFVQDTAGTYSGIISGTGAVDKTLGGDLTLSGANSYSGGTTIESGTVFISSDTSIGAASGFVLLDGGYLGSVADITTARTITVGPLGGGFNNAAGTTLTDNGRIVGAGQLTKLGAGTTILTGANSYTGGTVITGGVLQVSSNSNLGALVGPLTLDGGTLRTTADMTTSRATTLGAGGGTLETAAGTTLTDNSTISGGGLLTKTGDGALILTGTNSYTGGTLVTGGVIEIANDASLGAPSGTFTLDGGTLRITQSVTAARDTVLGPAGGTVQVADGVDVNYAGTLTGSGSYTKTGGGNLFLNGTGNFTGGFNLSQGSMFVNGDFSAATGTTTVQSGARLSGDGILGGPVVVGDGATLTAGSASGAPGALTMENLTLNSGSNLFLNVVDTTVGGALNDLINVNGNLVLDGQVNVLEQQQTLGPGVYRIINYSGALTDNGLDIGSIETIDGTPTRPLSGFSVQTAIPGQVNLINTQGLSLTYWDGTVGPKNDNAIQGGDGIWRHAGPAATSNWTDPAGAVNAPWADDQFAIFVGNPGTVSVSQDSGAVTTSGMQFGVSNYLVQGDPLTLVGTADTPGEAVIRVGDGTSAGSAMTATIGAPLTGDVLLRKTDAGTLILSGANSYTGGTRIEGGVLEVASDANLGAVSTGLTLDSGTLRTTADIKTDRATVLNSGGGTFDTSAGTTLSLTSAITGAGALTHVGSGALALLADSNYSGGTTIQAGTLQLGDGGTTGSITGPVIDSGTLLVNRSDQLVLDGAIAGNGSLVQAGTGMTVLAADNLFTGTTTISAGTLQLGNGGSTGTVAGPIVDNAALTINHANDYTLGSAISGTGTLVHNGSGRTILTGTNSYAGTTTVASGRLYIDGDQGAATGAAVAMSGTRLGGSGTIGGNVTIQDGATLSPGSDSLVPGILTINGNLTLNPDSTLLYNITSTVVGGTGNDLTVVGKDLTLDGTIDVVDQGQNLGPGVYRIFNYGGALADNGLTIGGYTSDGATITRPLTDFIVQTVIPGQVNLVNVSGADLNYWDGEAVANKNNGLIEGGDGTWRHSGPASTSNWTDPAGSLNAPWADGQFAIFLGAPGTVTVSLDSGAVTSSGMQFGVDGYRVTGDEITLVSSPDAAGEATVRVGDGTAAGAGMTATIDSVLTGDVLLRKTDAGTLVLNGVNTYTGGTRIEGGVIQIAADTALGSPTSQLTLDGGTLRMTASLTKTRPITMGPDGGTFDTVAGTATSIVNAIDGSGALAKIGDGTLTFLADNSYTGGTTIGAGILQLGNGGTAGSVAGDIADNASLVVNRSNELLVAGTISGTGSLTQAGTGTTILSANNTYTGGTTISAGTLQIGNGGTTGHVIGDILDNGTLVIDRSDTKLTPGVISGTGQLIQAGAGTTVLQADNSYTGGTTISAGTLQLGDGGTVGGIAGDVLDNGTLAFNRSDDTTFAGAITGTGAMVHLGNGKTTLTGFNTYTGGTTISAGTVQVGDGGTTGTIFGDIVNNGVLILDRADDITYGGSISGTGSTIKEGAGRFIATGTGTYTGGTTISAGVLQLGNGGTGGSILGDVVDNAALVVNRSDSLLLNGVISGTGSFEQAGTGTTVFAANNSYTGGTLISAGTLQIGNGGTTGLVPGDVVDNGTLVINRSNTKTLEGVVSGAGQLVQAGLGTLIINKANSYSGGTAIEAGTLQISSDDNLGATSGGLRISGATLHTTADITTARATVLAQGVGTIDVDDGTTLTHDGVLDGAGGLTKAGAGTLILSGANAYAGPTDVAAGTLRVNGNQGSAIGPTSVESGATLGGSGIIGGDVTIADGGILAPGNSPGTLTVNGNLSLSAGSILDYEFGHADVAGGSLNDLTNVGGNLVLDGTINVTVPAGGSFDPGVYRVFNYAGSLIDNGLTIGTIPSTSYYVQTSIANQVNLVNTVGLTLNYWDGAAGPKNNGVVNGGDGVWQNSAGNDNWTIDTGTPNAPFSDGAFAIFAGTPGHVTVDQSLGAINVSGMQFAADGYVLGGDPINLTAINDVIRVGDGTAAGAGMTATIDSVLAGTGALAKTDLGTLILAADNSYTGGTTITGGTLQLGNGGTAGSVLGDITDNGTLAFNRSDAVTYGGTIVGTGALTQAGPGTLTLTGSNSYSGATNVSAGALYVEGDQSAATGLTSVANATLGGSGTIGGSVVVAGAGTLAPGSAGAAPGTLGIAGDLSLAGGSHLAYGFGQANVAGGPLNDLTQVGGNLALDGTIDVTLAPGGSLDAGVYRVISYGGTLTDNGLAIGAIPSPGFVVQTSVANQVNLVNTAGLTLNFWDGAAGPKNDGVVNGGDGVWQAATGNDNWTSANGTPNAPFTDAAFAIFTGAAGSVTVDQSLGAVNIAGAQFATDGYVISGDPINLVAGTDAIRVGDGSTVGAGMTATINSVLAGAGTLAKTDLGTLILAGANSYTGGTAINGGVLQIASDTNLGDAGGVLVFDGGTLRTTADITTARATTLNAGGGTLETLAGTTLTLGGTVGGAGALTKTGAGTLILTGTNSYAGGTAIDGGVVQVASDANLGAAAGPLSLDTGTLRTAADLSSTRAITLGAGGGTIETAPAASFVLAGAITGEGALGKTGDGTLVLTGDATHTGGTTISAGTLQIGDGGTAGTIAGSIVDNAALVFDRSDAFSVDGPISGSGSVTQAGAGATTLTGANSYAGATMVASGSLYVNGDQSAATGLTSVASGALLGGSGTVGGAVDIADGGTLAPGLASLAAGTLTINGPLTLHQGSTLFYNIGDTNVGGALNDLVQVNNDLVLAGTINIVDQGQTLGPGVYRVFNYTGTLTNNGLAIGNYMTDPTAATGPITGFSVQTAIPNQVNLVNANGLALNFWDGDAGPVNDNVVNGGSGNWRNGSTINWTDAGGAVNATWADSNFAVFTATPGTVTVVNDNGQVRAAGMQFETDGYLLTGAPLELVGDSSIVRVGDGTAAGAGVTATIDAPLIGHSTLVKTDAGTLILNGANTYTGGTAVNGGVVQVANDTSLGDASGGLSFDGGTLRAAADMATTRAVTLDGSGTLETASTLTLGGSITGVGALTKTGEGTVVLTADDSYSGGTTIAAGTLQLGGGGTTGGVTGTIADNGALIIDRSNTLLLDGAISGTGSLEQAGSGTTILASANSYSGGTTISAGTFQLGNGGTTGSVVGNITNNGTLAFDRSDMFTYGGAVSGTGSVVQSGAGALIFTGANSYAGATTVSAGTLLVDGDQSAATGLTTVASGATLGGTGTIGGGTVIADGGTLAAGDNAVGTLTIKGGLTLGAGATIAYEFGQPNVAGGTLNDLVDVGGDLELDGTIDVTAPAGGSFDPGIYRVLNYSGTLTDNGLAIGTIPAPGYFVQTSVANQVNLINTTGLTLNFWDGAAGPKNDGVVNGGDGVWQAARGNDNWTLVTGTANAPFTDAAFAVFTGTPGDVTVDQSLGAVTISGAQFAVDGYVVSGDPVDLVAGTDVVRVGDGTAAGAGMTATIHSELTGAGTLAKTDLGTLILLGANSYTGGTAINGGTLQVSSDANLGAASGGLSFDGGTLEATSPMTIGRAVTLNDGGGTIATDGSFTLTGDATGTGGLTKGGTGTLILTGANSYTGGTMIAMGTVQLGDGGTTGGVTGPITDNGALVAKRSDALVLDGVISGTGTLEQAGSGTTILTADNSYSGGTTISAGTLQLGNGGTSGSIVGDIADNGTLMFDRSDMFTYGGTVSGTGSVVQNGTGTTTLTGMNSYAGGTVIDAGTLQVSSDANLGTSSGTLTLDGGVLAVTANMGTARATTLGADGGTISTADATMLNHDGIMSGTGALTKTGTGTLILNGANSYTGATTVSAGTLLVDGNQSAATGAVTVASGATLGGSGTIGGSTAVQAGATLAPGSNGVGTLAIAGDLTLDSGSILDYQLGAANMVGGAGNDLTTVGGDLVLAGTINVTVPSGGSFDPGIYRVFDYEGTLTDNGLAIGTIPSNDVFVQTSIANQVNLVNTAGLTLNFWDGAAGPKNDGVVNGGDGVWQAASGNDNWTTSGGTPNAPFADASFAVFSGSAGTVTVDTSLGAINVSGIQFATGGYVVSDGTISLVAPSSIIRVDDGTAGAADITATINSTLAGDGALTKTGAGTLILTGTNSYTGGTAINAGTLQVASDANLGAASGGLSLDSGTLRTTGDMTTARAATLGVGGGTFETKAGTLTASGVISGVGTLTKTGPGTLVLAGANSYAGGTAINGGVMEISGDANLGAAAGAVTFHGGTLQTSADLSSDRTLDFADAGAVLTDSGTTFTFAGTLAGTGPFTKDGAGTWLITSDNSAFVGTGSVAGGTLAVDGALGGALAVETAGRLEGNGQVGDVANTGTVAPGRSAMGMLTVTGDYVGNGGTLEIEAALGDDNSPADRLVVAGSTSGSTQVNVINRDGLGAQTIDGIKIVDVGGASNGTFLLNGDYVFDGSPTVIAGAFGYRLYKNGIADPNDGDWYLRSSLFNPPPGGGAGGGGESTPPPLYQPGVPVYEAYPATLLALNGLPTLQQRVGNRSWVGASADGGGIWGRMESSRERPQAAFSTSMADRSVDRWQAQVGTDVTLLRRDDGSALIAGIAGDYGEADADIRSLYGNGRIKTKGYGVSASLTWYGPQGFYTDAQAKFSWYDSDLKSSVLGKLADGNNGTGQAYSLEVGKRSPVGGNLSLTPQVQMVYSTVDFDRFTDPSEAVVSPGLARSLKTRWGISLDYQKVDDDGRRTHLYSVANLSYEWLDGTRVDVSGTPIANRDERLWGELGLGGSYSLGGRFTLYAEVSAKTALKDFGNSYSYKGIVGLRMGF